jgi:CHAT domain-containing protein
MIRAARQEAVACATAMGANALVDGDATRDRFLAGLREARYVHFSGHGMLDVAAPAFQTLFLAPSAADDGRLFAHDLLADSFAGCELVSLSACESGLGRFDIGDNLMGIPAALLAGGVRHIVATLWPVAVEPARVFFGLLYGALAGGATGLDAFAHAQRTTRDRYPALRDWGAFFLTGV